MGKVNLTITVRDVSEGDQGEFDIDDSDALESNLATFFDNRGMDFGPVLVEVEGGDDE